MLLGVSNAFELKYGTEFLPAIEVAAEHQKQLAGD